MKKKGTSLIEVVAALLIIVLAGVIASKMIINGSRSISLIKEKEQGNRILYAIENEIKYNLTLEEYREMTGLGKISLAYSKDFMDRLITTPLYNMQRGAGIDIEKIKEINEGNTIFIKLTLTENIANREIKVEREFIKSYWMD